MIANVLFKISDKKPILGHGIRFLMLDYFLICIKYTISQKGSTIKVMPLPSWKREQQDIKTIKLFEIA